MKGEVEGRVAVIYQEHALCITIALEIFSRLEERVPQ